LIIIKKLLKIKLTLTLIAACAIALTFIGSFEEAEAAAYLKFDGVDGEATDQDHKDWINLLSFSHSITRDDTSSGSTRTRASATLGDVVVVKELDKSSPKIAESALVGKTFPKIEFHLTSSAGTYLQYELKNVMVTSYSISGDADDRPTEEISLNFEEIKVTYTEMDSQGNKKGNVEYSWKVEEGTS
jgi:type VI secretion system secreted protein Hcp